MRHHEGVFGIMNAVIYYSNTGQSRAVAEYLAERLGYPAVDMESCGETRFERLVLVFPVHCQNIPEAVHGFLERITAGYLIPVATYGKMGYGNILWEIQRKYTRHTLAAGAYIPAKHTYLAEDLPFDRYHLIDPLVDKIINPAPICLPRTHKDPFADLCPSLRSRLGVRLYRTEACDACGLCTARCPQGAIREGVTNRKCIRCLRCVSQCPKGALGVKLGFPLRLYLRKKRMTETVVYV